MKKYLLPFAVCALIALPVHPAAAMTGKAVAVVALRNTSIANPSRLIVCTVQDNRTTAVDTILKNGVFYFPTFSFNGRRIAFYRNGAGVSIIDRDGNNLRTVAKTMNWGWGDQEQTMAWPGSEGGKWLYYHKPASYAFRYGTGEIWKVNVDDTSQNILVCDYKKVDTCSSGGWFAPGLWNWSLSADAQYCVTHTIDNCHLLGWEGDRNAIIPSLFPPKVDPATGWINPRLTAAACNGCGLGGCNSGLSASGTLVTQFSGAHNQIYCFFWNHATRTVTGRYTIGTGASGSLDQYRDVEVWLAPGGLAMGDAFMYPRNVSNSDQIIAVLVNWQYCDQFTKTGSNLVITNWKDKKAVMVTNNPDKRPTNSSLPPSVPFWYAEPGDFSVDNTGHRGCYMDVNGNWIAIPGADTSEPVKVMQGVSSGSGFRSAGGITAIYDLKGARMGGYDSREPARLRRGGYVIVDRAGLRKALIMQSGESRR